MPTAGLSSSCESEPVTDSEGSSSLSSCTRVEAYPLKSLPKGRSEPASGLTRNGSHRFDTKGLDPAPRPRAESGPAGGARSARQTSACP